MGFMKEKLLDLIYEMCTKGPINFLLYLLLNVLSVNVERFMDLKRKKKNLKTFMAFNKKSTNVLRLKK